MSIDLYLELTRPISLRLLLPKARAMLAEILGVPSVPELTLHALEGGERVEVATHELIPEESPLFLVSMTGEPETVALNAHGTHVSLMMASWRSNLEYALGAALAIALARELGVRIIHDDSGFFSDEHQISPDDLLQRLKIAGTCSDYQEAAAQLEGRLDRDPRKAAPPGKGT